MNKKTAYLEVRSQHAKGRSKMFHGPDTYVAVQIVPEGVERLYALNDSHARSRGIEIRKFGEGYGEHTGPNSMLGRAIERAEQFVKEFNKQYE